MKIDINEIRAYCEAQLEPRAACGDIVSLARQDAFSGVLDLLDMIEQGMGDIEDEPQGLDGQPKRKLRKVCNLREDLKADKPIEERLEELRQIREEKDRLDEAAETCKEYLHISETCKENANSFTGLDGAAKEYARQYTENDNGNGGDDWEDDIRITFEAGAKWMAERGWHEEAIIKGSNDVVWLNYNVELPIDLAKYFKDGDKVIVQIRKAD